MREFDMATSRFVVDGFALPEAKRTIDFANEVRVLEACIYDVTAGVLQQ